MFLFQNIWLNATKNQVNQQLINVFANVIDGNEVKKTVIFFLLIVGTGNSDTAINNIVFDVDEVRLQLKSNVYSDKLKFIIALEILRSLMIIKFPSKSSNNFFYVSTDMRSVHISNFSLDRTYTCFLTSISLSLSLTSHKSKYPISRALSQIY